jgi:single-stranded DNA-binding protein
MGIGCGVVVGRWDFRNWHEERGEKKKRKEQEKRAREKRRQRTKTKKKHKKREVEEGRAPGALGQEAGTRVGCPSRAARR